MHTWIDLLTPMASIPSYQMSFAMPIKILNPINKWKLVTSTLIVPNWPYYKVHKNCMCIKEVTS